MGKLKYILIFAAILAMPGCESAEAAQLNGLKNFLNNLDRRVCQKFNATCKTRSKQTATKRKKQTPAPVTPAKTETSAATPITEPPIPVEKPKIAKDVAEPTPLPFENPFEKPKAAQDVAEPAPIPRAKPQELSETGCNCSLTALPAASNRTRWTSLRTPRQSPPRDR